MKKINFLVILILIVSSCQKDDEIFVPECNPAENLTASNVSYNSVTLSWEGSDIDNSLSYKIEYGLSGFVIGSGTIQTVTSNSINLQGLVPNTTYQYYVQTLCSANNISVNSVLASFTTVSPPILPEFRQNLSELNLFQGELGNLQPSVYTFEYELNSSLYTDYALKQRIIALPEGTTMDYVNDDLPNFPNNTVIAKTFYYNNNDGDLSQGKNIIETRVMIKLNGTWEFGDYVWNTDQTDAVLDNEGSTVPINWTDINGVEQSVNYKIPSSENCFTCHQSYNASTLIGPKLRSMNFTLNGTNQLQSFINNGHLSNLSDIATVQSLPNWEDTTVSEDRRVRAYFDVNCAHCHTAGGYHNENFFDALNLDYETSFDDSNIYDQRSSILTRIQTSIEGYSMPYLGVTSPHQEALDLIVPYLESL